jgi:hypothetical protein
MTPSRDDQHPHHIAWALPARSLAVADVLVRVVPGVSPASQSAPRPGAARSHSGRDLAGHLAKIAAGALDRRPAPVPVAVVDAVDDQPGLEHECVRDHQVVAGVGPADMPEAALTSVLPETVARGLACLADEEQNSTIAHAKQGPAKGSYSHTPPRLGRALSATEVQSSQEGSRSRLYAGKRVRLPTLDATPRSLKKQMSRDLRWSGVGVDCGISGSAPVAGLRRWARELAARLVDASTSGLFRCGPGPPPRGVLGAQ